MVTIEIDGKKITAPDGAMVIEAADEAGIYIPRFCYHKKLSIAANCRMCLVEVEKVAKPLPACATPVTEGMRVFTRSPDAIAAQKGMMEFLLINHPLDCPICDQGGECELQDIAMGYGRDVSEYTEKKRVVKDKNLGPLISTDMTRCIHCTRCVRFGDEIAGIRELGATGRGEHMEIGTYIERSLKSEMSGNVIDLCPVGALTSKPFRFSARAWELVQRDGIAPHDAIGSNLYYHVQNQRVMRIVPKENESINETWISDRDRFSYTALSSPDRLTQPMVKIDGAWRETDWQTALSRVTEGLREIIHQHGAEQIGVLASPSATIEEYYLLQKLMRHLGTDNLDYRLRQTDFSAQDHAPLFPWLGQSIEELERNELVFLIGSNIRKDQPIAAHRLRKAALNGTQIVCLNAMNYDFHFTVAQKIISPPQYLAHELAGIAKAVLKDKAKGLDSIVPTEQQQAIADLLRSHAAPTLLLGTSAMHDPQFGALQALALSIADHLNGRLGYLPEGANSAGACLAGMLPHRAVGGAIVSPAGHDAAEMLRRGLQAYLLFNVEPDLDCAMPANAALQNARFVVGMNMFRSAHLDAHCDVLLPIAANVETAGTYVNVEGRWQSFNGVAKAPGDARPGWKVLRVLGNLLDVPDFDYLTSEQVRDELRRQTENLQADHRVATELPRLNGRASGWFRIADVPIYSGDGLVRRAAPLQASSDAVVAAAYLNNTMAQEMQLATMDAVRVRADEREIVLPIIIDDRVPDHSVFIPAGLPQTALLGHHIAPISIDKAGSGVRQA